MVGFAFVFLLFLRREVSLDVIAIPMIHCVMKNVFLLIVVIIVGSCAKQQMEQQQLSVLSIETKSTNDCYVYNTSAKIWMTIQDDPYKVSNLQTIAQSNGIDVLVKPTHYALKLFPKNEQELNNLIIRDDISFSYIPFGYTCVSASIADSLSRSNNTCKYREEEKYFTVSQQDFHKQLPLPVLYAAWPVDKPLPDKYDYTIEYYACIPDFLEKEGMSTEKDLLNSCLGTRNLVLSGYVYDHDDLLGCHIPIKNLRLRLSYGLSSIETYTNENGFFVFSGNINTNAMLKCVFENSQFRITDDSLFSMVESVESVATLWFAGNPAGIYLGSKALIIHRAANHFFNGGHAIITPEANFSIRINFMDMDSQYYGSFNPYITLPSIDIKQSPNYDDPRYLSNVLHELGHFNHYQRNGGWSNYYYVISLIKESYADYVSWYVGRDYYTVTNSGVYNPEWEDSLKDSGQYWLKTYSSSIVVYSPLFIDLYDNYNQNVLIGPSFNDDRISGVPHSVIQSILAGQQTWQDLKNSLYGYVGVYYSYDDYSAFVEPYDYCVTINSF